MPSPPKALSMSFHSGRKSGTPDHFPRNTPLGRPLNCFCFILSLSAIFLFSPFSPSILKREKKLFPTLHLCAFLLLLTRSAFHNAVLFSLLPQVLREFTPPSSSFCSKPLDCFSRFVIYALENDLSMSYYRLNNTGWVSSLGFCGFYLFLFPVSVVFASFR